MNEKKAVVIKDVIQIIIHYIPVSILEVLMVLLIYEKHISFVRAFALVLMPLAFYAVRMRIHKPLLYLLAHFAVFAVVLLLPGLGRGERLFGGAVSAAYLCASIALHMKKDEFKEKERVYDIPVAALIGIVAAEYFIAAYRKETELLPGMATMAVLLMLGYYTVHYTTNYLNFFRSNRAAARNMPKGKMLKEGGVMTAVFTATATLILYLCAKASFVDNWFQKLLLTLRRWISYLLSLIPARKQQEEIVRELPAKLPETIPSGSAVDVGEPGMLAQAFDRITGFFAIGAMVCFVVGLIISIVIAYVRGFDKGNSEDEIKEKIKKEKVEKIKPEKAEEKRGTFAFLSAGERIRQIFAKTIRRRLKEEKELQETYHVGAMTARELHVLFPEERRGDYMELAALYEKARYSPEECESKDVQKARTLSQLLKRL